MTKANEDTVDPVTNDDSLSDTPRETLDPVPDHVGCDVKPRRRKPSMRRRGKNDTPVR